VSPASVAGLTAQAVADLVGGRLLGDGAVVLRGVRPLGRAGAEMLSLAVSPRYADELRASRAGAALVPESLAGVPEGPRTKIVVHNPSAALVRVLEALYPDPGPKPGIDPTARLGPGVVLGDGVSIGPFVVLGRGVRIGARCRLAERVSLGDDVVIGDDTIMEPGVVCYGGSRIGSRVVLKANAVIGGAGFGFVSDRTGHRQIPHVGGCIVEDDVQIGSGCCVDRGSIDDTVVGQGTKIDNLVHVAHNSRIGARCLLMAGSGLAGSVRMGDDVILAGHAGVIDHVDIGDGARIGAKSAVFGDVPAGASVSGHPARSHRQFLRAQGALYRLAPIVAQLERLVGGRDDG
jgi:UDP-3-O-[3-hydroxymyristoyl] glucosamine N-acyltransferase